MKARRVLLVATALAAVGCNLVLGIQGDYEVEDAGGVDASSDGGARLPDATIAVDGSMVDGGHDTGPEGGPIVDSGMDADANMLVCDPDASPLTAQLGSKCCRDQAVACTPGQFSFESIICSGGAWIPNGACAASDLCRTDLGEYPEGGAYDGGVLMGGTANTLGRCATEISACVGHVGGDVVCAGARLIVCGADLTTDYSETCGSAALCAAHTGPHCPACLTGQDFECNGAQLLSCVAGQFADDQLCATADLCKATSGACTPETCNPGAYHCQGDQLEQCAGGAGFNPVGASCGPSLCDSQLGTCDVCIRSQNLGCNGAQTGYDVCAADGQSSSTVACSGMTPHCFEDGMGSDAKCVQCLSVATDCPPAPTCQTATCTGGTCGTQPVNDNTVVSTSNGGCASVVCMAGAPTATDAPSTASCTMTDGVTPGTCDGMGNCAPNM